MSSFFEISFSASETFPRFSNDLIRIPFSSFIDLLILPGIMPLIHRHYASQPQYQDYPSLLVQLSRYFDLTEKLALVILQQTLNISNPHLLFRSDDINILFLKEFTNQTALGLPRLLEPILTSLRIRKFSPKSINQITFKLLHLLNDYQIPLELNRFYSLVNRTLSIKFPGMENVGLSSLFFLQYLYPLILNCFSHDTLFNSELYRENSTEVVKLIQALANGTELPFDHDGYSPKKCRQIIKRFLARLINDDWDSGYSPLSTSVPSVLSVYRFFRTISQEADVIKLSIASIGSLAPKDLDIKWSQFVDVSKQIACLISQQPPRSMDKSIYEMESEFSCGDLTFFSNTSATNSFSKNDLAPIEPNVPTGY